MFWFCVIVAWKQFHPIQPSPNWYRNRYPHLWRRNLFHKALKNWIHISNCILCVWDSVQLGECPRHCSMNLSLSPPQLPPFPCPCQTHFLFRFFSRRAQICTRLPLASRIAEVPTVFWFSCHQLLLNTLPSMLIFLPHRVKLFLNFVHLLFILPENAL